MRVLKVCLKLFYFCVDYKNQKIKKVSVKSSLHIVCKILNNTSVNIPFTICRLFISKHLCIFLLLCSLL